MARTVTLKFGLIYCMTKKSRLVEKASVRDLQASRGGHGLSLDKPRKSQGEPLNFHLVKNMCYFASVGFKISLLDIVSHCFQGSKTQMEVNLSSYVVQRSIG